MNLIGKKFFVGSQNRGKGRWTARIGARAVASNRAPLERGHAIDRAGDTVSRGLVTMGILTATDTINIVKALKPRLGEKAAVAPIRYIESAHTGNLATKADLNELRPATKAGLE